MGFRTCAVGSSSNARVENSSVRVMRIEYTFPAHALTFRSPSPDGRGGQGVRMSLNALLLLVQAATQSPRLAALKQEAVQDVASRAQFTQQMVDQIFSYGELGFQETETSRYLIDLLRKNGFTVREGIAGIPTAWVATWGSGKPIISLGSDIDDIPQASQKPGVACHAPMIEGAPGHGEGHNSGQAVNITAALAVKKIMEREHLPGTLQIWPGVAEELVGTKAYFVREGVFKDVDVVIFSVADTIAHAAAMMTSTTLLPPRILGSAWPGHFNRIIAQTMYENIKEVGLPQWSEADQRLAHALQRDIGAPDSGLATRLDTLRTALKSNERTGGGSDDIGDVSWNVPTVTLRVPSNIPGLPGHNWANAISMATPIAPKGATAGAKVMAMTVLDLLMRPELVTQAWDYFRTVQTKDIKNQPLIRPQDRPAIELNRDIMARCRPQMRRFYYDPSKYRTYLQQLGITYPTERAADGSCAGAATP